MKTFYRVGQRWRRQRAGKPRRKAAGVQQTRRYPGATRMRFQAALHYCRMPLVRFAGVAVTLLAPLAFAQKFDVALGKQFAKEIERQFRVLPDPEATDYATHLATQIAQSAGMSVPVTVKVLENNGDHAFNFPGGFLYVTTGLIARAETEAEFAGVLAHEIAHLKLNNGYYSLHRHANGGAVGRWFVGCSRWTLNSQVPLASLAELRNIEQETDTAALKYLQTAGYDPLGMLEFYNKLRYEEPRLAQTWSSHDLMELHSYVEESVSPNPEFIVTTAAFDAIRKRFLPEPKRTPSLASRPTLTRVNSPIAVH